MIFKHKQYFVAGIGTDIGKTFFVTKICQELRLGGVVCNAIKPVASGFCDDDLQSDSAKILRSLGEDVTLENINKITPWRFTAPLAPSFAAILENREIDFFEVKNFCAKKINSAKNRDQFLFIEAAGGLMTPLCVDKTFLDLAVELEIPVILISANYLGSISHTLCAVEAAKARGVRVEVIVLNNFLAPQLSVAKNAVDIKKVAQEIENFTKIRVEIYC